MDLNVSWNVPLRVFRWPAGFPRVPDEDWAKAPVATLAAKYDSVGRHGWYSNLDATVAELAEVLQDGEVLVDYSGGTGLLADRWFARVGAREVGIVDADSSPKFLAMALEKYRDEPRLAFRLIRFLKEEKRLQGLDEVLPFQADALASANAIHLYYALDETLAAWRRALRPGAHVHVQSGNIRNPDAASGAWIIDDTVTAVDVAARAIVRSESRFARHQAALDDAERMRAHDAFREKVFLPPRDLSFYLDALERAGFRVMRVAARPVAADAGEWHEFLAAYSDAVLGWVGGHEKVEGRPPTREDLDDRLALMRLSLGVVLTGRESFDATWTYISCRRE